MMDASSGKWHADSANLRFALEPGGLCTISFEGGSRTADVATARYGSPVGAGLPSFEMEIVGLAEDGTIAIGLISQKSPLQGSLPGWQHGEIGLHVDDGRLYLGSVTGREFALAGEFSPGDRLSCGIEFLDSGKKNASGAALGVYFNKNDMRVGWTVIVEPPPGGFFPAVGLLGRNTAVKLRVYDAASASGVSLEDSQPTFGVESSLHSRENPVQGVGQAPASGTNSMLVSSTFGVNNVRGDTASATFQSPLSMSTSSFASPVDPVRWGRHERLRLEKTGRVEYDGTGHMHDFGVAVAFKPLLASRAYFEVRIVDDGEHGNISVGLTCADHKLTTLPGWQEGSLAYHADDGCLFTGSAQSGKPFGSRARQGDRIGCGLRWSEPDPDRPANPSDRLVEVFFMLNGSPVGSFVTQQLQGGFYPTIGLTSKGESVVAYFCEPPTNLAQGSINVKKVSQKQVSLEPLVASGDTRSVNSVTFTGQQQTPLGSGQERPVSTNDMNSLSSTTSTAQERPTSANVVNSLSSTPGLSTVSERPRAAATAPEPLAKWTCDNLLMCVPFQQGVCTGHRIEYAETAHAPNPPACALMQEPLSGEFPYFEVTLGAGAAGEKVSVGVATPDCSLNKTPGSAKHFKSIAVSAPDGLLWYQGESNLIAPLSTEGDRIGCGLDLSRSTTEKSCIVFWRNGSALGSSYVDVPPERCHGIVCLESCCQAVTARRQRALPSRGGEDSPAEGLSELFAFSASQQADVLQFPTPLSTQAPYFEFVVENPGQSNRITIGVTITRQTLDVPPGLTQGSAGFLPGRVLNWPIGAESTSVAPVLPAQFKRFDHIGVGISGTSVSNFMEGTPLQPFEPGRAATIFFTCNGQVVSTNGWMLPREAQLFPVVSLRSVGESVRVVSNPVWPARSAVSTDWRASSYMRMVTDQLAYTGRGRSDFDVGAAVAAHCLSPSEPYFELKITDSGDGCYIGVGIGDGSYCTNTMIGWQPGAVGYHADDGRLYQGDGRGKAFGPVCEQGDYMGCGVRFGPTTNDGHAKPLKVFFTRNHQLISEVDLPTPGGDLLGSVRPSSLLHPLISLHSPGAMVRPRLRLRWPPTVTGLGPGWARGSFMHYNADEDIYHYTIADAKALNVGTIQSAMPVTPANNYFEATIVDSGASGRIAVGVVSCGYQLGIQPGWGQESVAYHADDGRLFISDGFGKPFSGPSVQGDVIGCGVIFPSGTQTLPCGSQRLIGTSLRKSLPGASARPPALVHVTVFFTRNGKTLGERRVAVPPGGFFAAVGLHSLGEKVRVNLEASFPPKSILGPAWASSVRLASPKDSKSTIRYTGKIGSTTDFGVAKAKDSLSPQRSFFAAKIVTSSSPGSKMIIGLVVGNSATAEFVPYSLGLDIASGVLLEQNKPPQKVTAEGKVGDVVGCCVDFGLSKVSTRVPHTYVMFSVNGHSVARARLQCTPTQVFPAVVLSGEGEIRVMLSDAPPEARPRYAPIGWARSEHVQVHGNLVRRVQQSVATGLAQAIMPSLPESGQLSYYEAIILDEGKTGAVNVGFAELGISLSSQIGTMDSAVVLNLKRRCIFCRSPVATKPVLAVSEARSTIGCGILWSDKLAPGHLPAGFAMVIFTHNKEEIARLLYQLPDGLHTGELLPTITLDDPSAEVLVDMDASFSLPDTRWMQLMGAQITKDGRTISLKPGHEVCIAQYQLLSPEGSYFEIVLNGSREGVTLGLSTPSFLLNKHVGWSEGNSVAMHINDCTIRSNGAIVGYTPLVADGDRVGCGVNYAESSSQGGMRYLSVYFTHNGRIVARTVRTMIAAVENGMLCPSVEIDSPGACSVVVVDDPQPPPKESCLAPIGWMQSSRLMLRDLGHSLLYNGSGEGDTDTGLALAAEALRPEKNFFHIQLCSTGRNGYIAIGLADTAYSPDAFPGWCPFSVAYHADDGGIFHSSGKTSIYGPRCAAGDTMGCGVDFEATAQGSPDQIVVFFTKNGLEVARLTAVNPPGGLYPIIGLLTPGEHVFVDFIRWEQLQSNQMNIMS